MSIYVYVSICISIYSQTKLRLGGTSESKDFSEIVAQVGNKEFKPKFGCRFFARAGFFGLQNVALFSASLLGFTYLLGFSLPCLRETALQHPVRAVENNTYSTSGDCLKINA